MKVQSIRLRLTFWYSGVLLAALLVFGASLWVAVRHNVQSGIESRLTEAAQGVRTVLEIESDKSDFNEEITEYARAASGAALLRVRDGSGKEWLPDTPLLSMQTRDPKDNTGLLRGERYRTYSERVSVNGQNFEIETGISLSEATRMLEQLRALLLIAIPLVVAVAFCGGYWISGRALSPVDELTNAAMRISVENLSERLPVRKSGDELQRLAETWNEMLGRLQAAVQRITSFTADASHELRTPISVILTSAEVALRRERDAAEYREALTGIVSEAQRMTGLTEDLLALARSDSSQARPPFELIDLGELARETVRDVAASAEQRNIILRTEVDGAAPGVWANRSALRRVLLILLDNALKHTPAGGSIEVGSLATAGGVTIAVRDNGEGIAPGDIVHVFDRFYRADKSRTGQNGVGLGLSIAQAIARMHGSEIQVESVPAAGSRFFLTLPANPQKNGQSAAPAPLRSGL
jgi:two-component system heavy metal sensor histidine kinase CusS